MYVIDRFYREILSEVGIEYQQHNRYKIEVNVWVAATVESQIGRPSQNLKMELVSLKKNPAEAELIGALFRLGGKLAVENYKFP